MRVPALLVTVLLVAGCGGGEKPAEHGADKPAAGTPQTEDQKIVYTMGQLLARNLATFNLTQEDLPYLQNGLADGILKHNAEVPLEEYGPKIQEFANARAAASATAEKESSKDFLEKAAAEPGAKKLESGVIYEEITPGTGEQPKPTDRVKVQYEGTLIDGTVFDSSKKRGEPATFPLNGVVKCWTEGLQQMKVGGHAKLVCPPDTAYGDRGSPPQIKPGATLVFDVELLEILK
jgi:FKBP-type peptidyl-prolyl cis-trans isomerase FkpA